MPVGKIFVLLFLCSCIYKAEAQNAALKGKVIDSKSKIVLIGASVRLTNTTDTTDIVFAPSRDDGTFEFNNLKRQTYALTLSFVGYNGITRTVRIDADTKNLGVLEMTPTPIGLGDVVVMGNQAPVAQIGDTTLFNARAFKTNPDATVEDLITKMPTIVVESGNIKAQGEDVKQVLLDGKPFFGTDPLLALRNLPADAIDKIQVFDKLSDQAEFTGFDDGQSIKTINIITRPEKRQRQFGKFSTGYGEDKRYIAGGSYNSFQGDQRTSVLGLSNNINQQNFSQEDILGTITNGDRRPGSGGGGGGGGRGGGDRGRGGSGGSGGGNNNNFLVGQQDGITSVNSIGLNYSGDFTNDLEVAGSYFVNNTNNDNTRTVSREYIVSSDSSTYYNEQSDAGTKNLNHRLNMKIDYTLDEANSFTVRPQISYQKNSSTSSLTGINSLSPTVLFSRSSSDKNSTSDGYNFSGNIVYKHKFGAPGRTFSIDLGIRQNWKETGSDLQSLSNYYLSAYKTDTINQQSNGNSDGYTVSSRIIYTEPIFAGGLLQFNYSPSYSKSTSDTRMYLLDPVTEVYTILSPKLSNTFENQYTTQDAGIDLRLHYEALNFLVGISYQVADLHNDKTYPQAATVDKTFDSYLPNATLLYTISRKNNFRIVYRASTNAPSINQLQDVLKNSNPLFLSIGNPDLKQATSHTVVTRYAANNPQTNQSLFFFLTFVYTKDYIGTSTFIAGRDTILGRGIQLNRGSQLSLPVNLTHAWSMQSYVMYNFPIEFIQSNLNLSTGAAYAQTPGLVNNAESISKSYTLNQGFVLGSNISEEVDFTISYTINYNVAKYSLQPDLNSTYTTHVGGLKFNWIFNGGFFMRNDVAATFYNGLQGNQNQDYILWNIGMGKKFFEGDKGEIRLSVNDLLNQNTSIRRTVTDISIDNTTNRVLGRFVLLTLTYKLR